MSKFKIGDKVRVKDQSEFRTDSSGIPIKLIIHGNFTWKGDSDGEIKETWKDYYIVHFISSTNGEMQLGYEESNLVLINNKKSIMSNIKEFAKNLLLSDNEKLLREAGLKNSCSEYTQEAKDLVMEKLVADNEAYLLDIAKKQKEAEASK